MKEEGERKRRQRRFKQRCEVYKKRGREGEKREGRFSGCDNPTEKQKKPVLYNKRRFCVVFLREGEKDRNIEKGERKE